MRTNLIFHGGAGTCSRCGDELSCLPGCDRCLVEQGEVARQELAKVKRQSIGVGVGVFVIWMTGIVGIIVFGWRFPWQ